MMPENSSKQRDLTPEERVARGRARRESVNRSAPNQNSVITSVMGNRLFLVSFAVAGVVLLGILVVSLYDSYVARTEANANKKRVLEIAKIVKEFDDGYQIASVTGRIALSGPVKSMQDANNKLKDLPVGKCLKFSKDSLVTGQEQIIRGFLLFMDSSMPKNLSSGFINIGQGSIKSGIAGMNLCTMAEYLREESKSEK